MPDKGLLVSVTIYSAQYCGNVHSNINLKTKQIKVAGKNKISEGGD